MKHKPSADASSHLTPLGKTCVDQTCTVDFGLPPATPPRKQSRENGPGEGSRRFAAVTEPGREKNGRSEKLPTAQSVRKISPPSVSTGRAPSRLPPSGGSTGMADSSCLS